MLTLPSHLILLFFSNQDIIYVITNFNLIFREYFYTLAWSTIDMGEGKTNILVSGGSRGEIRMFHPSRKVCFHEFVPVQKRNIAVNSIVFHSEESAWMFCGTGKIFEIKSLLDNAPNYLDGCVIQKGLGLIHLLSSTTYYNIQSL